jgi:phage terminase large subunit-like protein
MESLCLISPYHQIRAYDVDICATAEDVAMRPVNDILDILDNARYRAKMKKHFEWTKEKITGLKYHGTIRGRTNNPKSMDGMPLVSLSSTKSTSMRTIKHKGFYYGLGKKPHPRRLYATTNGDVRDGPLDDLLRQAEQF